MHALKIGMILALCTVAVGCRSNSSGVAQVDGLRLKIELPKSKLVRGESFKLAVTATNRTFKPIHIEANTGTPVYVRVWSKEPVGWEQVRRYPQATTMVMSPWTIQARKTRRFEMQLTVEPDWPTCEPIRLTAELNGRDGLRPELTVEIVPEATQE